MATKIYREGGSPSATSLLLPQLRSSRRGSLSSLSSVNLLGKETVSLALDQIHTSASQSEALTAFNEYTSPPPSSSAPDSKGITGELQGGISGLYNRFRASVGNVKDVVGPNFQDDGSDNASLEESRAPTPASGTSHHTMRDSKRISDVHSKHDPNKKIQNADSRKPPEAITERSAPLKAPLTPCDDSTSLEKKKNLADQPEDSHERSFSQPRHLKVSDMTKQNATQAQPHNQILDADSGE